MSDLYVHLSPDFEAALAEYMRLRQVPSPAEALRLAVLEAVRGESGPVRADFSDWLGLALQAPQNPNPKFSSDDDLWN